MRSEKSKNEARFITWFVNGAPYKLHEDGRIEKPDGYISSARQWQFIGLIKRLPFGRGEFIPREECFDIPPEDFKFKNGMNRYMVVDMDHGLKRVWINRN